MMSDQNWRDNLLRHLVGTLDEPTATEVRAYLDDDDPTTKRLVEESRASVDRLLSWLEPRPVAASLRERLHRCLDLAPAAQQVRSTDERVADAAADVAVRSWRDPAPLRALTTLAAAIIVVGLAAIAALVADMPQTGVQSTRLASPMTPAEGPDDPMPSFDSDELLSFVKSCFELVTLQQPTPEATNGGRLLWDRTHQICYVFTPELPPAEEGNTYHLWFTPQESEPVPVAEFDVDRDGRACIQVDLPNQHTTYASASIRRGPQGDPSGAINDILTGTFNQ
jgi:hypothetical protein